MGINITAKTDYSYLLNSLGSSRGGSSLGNLNFLSDYASIKNGSYGKLMKAYFNTDAGKEVSSLAEKKTQATSATSEDTTKTLAKMQSTSDDLKESADALLATGEKAVFDEEDIVTAKAYEAVSAFVADYNSVLNASDNVNSSSILNKTLDMVNASKSNEKLLAKVGITIGDDNSLSLDKDAFMNASATTVKNLFNTTGGYAYRVSAQASLINFAADNEAAKANTYNFNGTYGNNFSAGNIFDSMF